MLQDESLHRPDTCWLGYGIMFHSCVSDRTGLHIKGNRDKKMDNTETVWLHSHCSSHLQLKHGNIPLWCFVINLKI